MPSSQDGGVDRLGNIEHSDPLADAAENAITALEQASKHQLSAVALDVRVSLRRALDQHRGAVEALDEAIKAARLFNRNGMTWLEYDRKLVELEQVVNRARGR